MAKRPTQKPAETLEERIAQVERKIEYILARLGTHNAVHLTPLVEGHAFPDPDTPPEEG
jgi:hypothetical protein